MAFTGKDGPSAPPLLADAQTAGAAAAQQPRKTGGLIQHSNNLADELRGLNYRLTSFVGAMVSPQPSNPISGVVSEVEDIQAKRPALEQLEHNLDAIRSQVTALSLTIGEAELL